MSAFGEIGLTGEVRRVGGGAQRVSELKQHGFSGVVLPESMVREIDFEGLELIGVSSIRDLMRILPGVKE